MSEFVRQDDLGALLLAEALESTAAEVHEVFHEIGTEFTDATVEKTVLIDRTSPPTEIIFRSHVVTSAMRGFKSPAYLASIRRRRSEKIARLIVELEHNADESGFAVWTQKPLDELRRLVQELSEAEEYTHPECEGNSCEILRQVRDTFLNSGWERYREPEVRFGVSRIVQTLAEDDEITGDHADNAMDTLLDMGLNPTVGLSWKNAETEEDEVPG
jgi:hypothetical protein